MKAISKKLRWLSYFFTILVIPVLVLSYYQLFYKSPRVDSAIAKLGIECRGHKSIVTAVRFSPGDSFIVTGSVDSTVKIWNRQTGGIIRSIKQPEGISYLDLSEDGNFIVTGSYDAIVRVWNLHDGSLFKEYKGHKGTVWTVAFSADGKWIASAGDDKVIRVWSVESGKLSYRLNGHKRIVWSVKFSPDGKRLVSCSFDFSFKIWNLANGSLLLDNKEHKETVVDVAYSHNGALLASTSDDKTIKLWSTKDGHLISTMKVPEHVQAVAFSPNDRLLLTGGRDKPMVGEFLQNIFGDSQFNKGVSARLWETNTGKLLQTFSRHSNDIMDVAFSHNGKWLASASADKTVGLWRIR